MGKIYLVSLILLLGFVVKPTSTVYVCGNSQVYHNSKTHSALKKCTHGLIEMEEAKAKKLGKRKCACRG